MGTLQVAKLLVVLDVLFAGACAHGCHGITSETTPPFSARFWVFYRFYNDFDHFIVRRGSVVVFLGMGTSVLF